MKYAISKELFPFSRFKPPISRAFLKIAVPFMKPPRRIHKNKDIDTKRHTVNSFDGYPIECFTFTPKGSEGRLPCLIYIHGGGFVLAAAGYHYSNAMRYAREVGCKVLFVNYRLSPKVQHPVFFEDCYAAATWLYENADLLGVDRDAIAIGGDSAGSALSVGVCMMAKDRAHPIRFSFTMLPYPYLDARNNSESCKKYTDTPMWNSELSKKMNNLTGVRKDSPDYVYFSPLEADCLEGMPPAYIETAEFDCLHDDGILYAERLRALGIPVALNETRGTMHGFDIVQRATVTEAAILERIKYMKTAFEKDN